MIFPRLLPQWRSWLTACASTLMRRLTYQPMTSPPAAWLVPHPSALPNYTPLVMMGEWRLSYNIGSLSDLVCLISLGVVVDLQVMPGEFSVTCGVDFKGWVCYMDSKVGRPLTWVTGWSCGKVGLWPIGGTIHRALLGTCTSLEKMGSREELVK